MTKRYTGGVVSSSLPTVNAAGASGVFNLSQQADAQTKNNWPPFKVEKSLRFRSAASPYLTKNYASYGDRTKITISVWVKRGTLANGATAQEIMTGFSGATRGGQLTFGDTTDQLLFEFGGSSKRPSEITSLTIVSGSIFL